MIKVLDKTKTLPQLVSENTNGLGRIEAFNDLVTEQLNGIYELEFDVLITDKHYEDLKINKLVKVNVNETGDEQIFRVYKIEEPINMVAHVCCEHISYDLLKVVVRPFTATGAVNAKNGLKTNVLGSTPFDIDTDITNSTTQFTLDIPRSFRECLGGYEGSMLDKFRGEYRWDNLTVWMEARRGSDHGTRIAYGKNLTDFKQEENNQSVYDAVYGYAVVDETTYLASDIYNKTGASNPKVKIQDFSGRYESGETPTGAELLQFATSYATSNDIEIPKVNITISFIPLWQTEEYKNVAPLERVFLGDTVHVFFDKLGVEASSRVIKTIWSPSLGRYTEIELGSAKSSLGSIISDAVNEAKEEIISSIDVDTGYVEQQLDDLSRLIINGLGLYKTVVQLQSGGVRIILHNKPTLADSDVQYYMSAGGIMVSTDYGTTWNAGYNTQTGELFTQALSTIVLKALQIYGSVITFGDLDAKYITASSYSINDAPRGVSFDGTGTIRMQPQEAFYINNKIVGSNYNYNEIQMTGNSSTGASIVELINNDDLHNYAMANYVQLDAHAGSNNDENHLFFGNFNTQSGVSIKANQITLMAQASQNQIMLYNRHFGSEDYANTITMLGQALTHTVTFYNYQPDGTTYTNRIFMKSTTDGTATNTIELRNRKSNGTTTNYISMDSTTAMMTIYSMSDIFINSAGAVRLNSAGGQDITLTSNDDIHLNFNDKLYFTQGGTQRQIGFGSITVSGNTYNVLTYS